MLIKSIDKFIGLFAVKLYVEFYSKFVYHIHINLNQKEPVPMPNIKPISDLRNYSEVLHDVAIGSPVFLTKNGRGRYAILDIQDYEKAKSALRLIGELTNGKKSGEEKGWLTSEDVRTHFAKKYEK